MDTAVDSCGQPVANKNKHKIAHKHKNKHKNKRAARQGPVGRRQIGSENTGEEAAPLCPYPTSGGGSGGSGIATAWTGRPSLWGEREGKAVLFRGA